jgi:nitrite reductase (NADH) small subunit
VDSEADWQSTVAAADLERAGKLVVQVKDAPVLLLWNNGEPLALNDTCIHKGRSLADGVLLSGRLVCAGHQWAFDLSTGYCRARDKYQPVYAVRIDGDQIQVDGSRVARTDDDEAAPAEVTADTGGQR